jgi:ribosome maturation factor RimP
MSLSMVIEGRLREWGDPLFRLVMTVAGPGGGIRKGEKGMSEEKRPKTGVAPRVRALAEPLAAELGLEVWDVQYGKEGAEWVLRIIIDKPGGVGIDDCVDMTHAVNPVLDQEDPVPQEYVLEVSSPGPDRKLTRPEHYEAYMGQPVRARLIRPLEDGTRELEGLLLHYEEGRLELQLDEETSCTLEKKELAWLCAIDGPWEGLDQEEG